MHSDSVVLLLLMLLLLVLPMPCAVAKLVRSVEMAVVVRVAAPGPLQRTYARVMLAECDVIG
jgi:hypothetical protein